MKIQTSRPWPEGTMPTPAEWRDWFLACAPDEQQHLAQLVLNDAEAATQCLIQDHQALLLELRRSDEVIRRALNEARRYRLAWRSARNRGRATALIRNHLRERGMWPVDEAAS